MTLEELQNLWREDSKIDPDNLHEESLKIPLLHSKYHDIQNLFYQKKKNIEIEYNNLYTEKTLYYTGKADPDVYNKNPWPHKVLKNDVHLYLNYDEELVKLKTKLDYYGYLMSYLTDILKMIHNRSFQIRDSIEFSKFIAGQ